MKYKNAKNVLPENLVKELQLYVQGEMIYVPGNGPNRAGWGESNGTRETYASRNREINLLFQSGTAMVEIAERYHLSEYSIKKIICSLKNKASHAR
ncbi:MAG: CD3324 family protein [Clostridiaceae bacterium]